jgi:hypothetical protein
MGQKNKSSRTNRRSALNPFCSFLKFPIHFFDHPIVSFIEAKYGNGGVGQFIKLSIHLVSQMKSEDGPIKSELSMNRWCTMLGFKRKGLVKFLDHLQNERHLNWESKGDVLLIEMPKLREVFDLTVPSRKSKKISEGPREEEIDPQETLVEEKEVTEVPSSSSDKSLLEQIKSVISEGNEDLPEKLKKTAFRYVGKNGPQPGLYERVEEFVGHQFRKSSESRNYGGDILARIKVGIKDGEKAYRDNEIEKKREEKRQLANSSPHKSDFLDLNRAITARDWDEIEVGEVNKFISALKAHFNDDEYVHKQFGYVLNARAAITERKKQKSLATGSTRTSRPVDDEDDDEVTAH